MEAARDRTEEKYILLVEDNPDDVKLTLRALAKSGISNRVEVVPDGVAAIEYLLGESAARNPSGLPAVVLLDLKMPKVNGIEVLQRIRADERTRAMPVVVLTTSNEERDRADCAALEVNAYILKPAKYSQFAEVVEQVNRYLGEA